MNKLFIIGSLFLIFSGTMQILGDDYLGILVVIMGVGMFLLRNKENVPVQPVSSDVSKKKRILITLLALITGCFGLLGYLYFVNGSIDTITVIITVASLLLGFGIQVYLVKRSKRQKNR
ncbi:MAG: hypothetical protein OCC49_13370 [Fibrobacterales bacterium]